MENNIIKNNIIKKIKPAEFTYDALAKAYYDCRRHKRNTTQAMEFEFEREKNLRRLYNELKDGSYEIGPSICFIVTEPKPREVWAGAFRDRIVHHLIYNAIYERFEARFIYDTYSCIAGRGTLKGAQRAKKFARNITQNYTKDAYFVKMDIKNYFVNINKQILFDEVMKYVFEPWLIDLIRKVIFHDPKKDVIIKSNSRKLFSRLPAYKSLFNSDDSIGLPIGNLTSQFFSNVYLNPVDQYAKRILKCKYYLRYVDDILVIDEDAGFLNHAYAKINRFLEDNLKLELNHKKKNINHIYKGFDFVGHVVKPNRTYLRVRTKKKCYKIINEWKNNPNMYNEEVMSELRKTINSYLGMMRHTDSYNLRKDISQEIGCLFIKLDEEYRKVMLNIA